MRFAAATILARWLPVFQLSDVADRLRVRRDNSHLRAASATFRNLIEEIEKLVKLFLA